MADIFHPHTILWGTLHSHSIHNTFKSRIFQLAQDSQCTYNVILRRVRVTIVAVDKQWESVSQFLLSLSGTQSACDVLYCNLWCVWCYHAFTHCYVNSTIFEKEVIKHKMCVLIFSTALIPNNSHSKNWMR